MERLPDAPWIRDAELNGLPEDPEVECPVCGSKTCDQIFLDKFGEAVGCEYCLKALTVWDWLAQEGSEVR